MRPTVWSKKRPVPPYSHFRLEVDFQFTRDEAEQLRRLLTGMGRIKRVIVQNGTIAIDYTNTGVNDMLCQIKVSLYEFAYNNPDLPQKQVALMTNNELAAHLKAGLRPAKV